MRKMLGWVGAILMAVSWSPMARAYQPAAIDPELSRQMEALSRSLTTTGSGWAAYARLLHPNYSRSSGGTYERREPFLGALREWWDHGLRVASRDERLIGVDRAGNVAVIRRQISERFVDRNGAPADGFSGYVTDIWLLEDGRWQLLSANVETAPRPGSASP